MKEDERIKWKAVQMEGGESVRGNSAMELKDYMLHWDPADTSRGIKRTEPISADTEGRNETPENKMEMLKMVFEKKADKKRSGIDRSIFSHFQRSKSMEHLPIRKADAGVNICALRAVFEPKGSPIKRFHPKYFHLPGKSAAKHEVTFATPWHIAASTYEKPEKYTSGRGGKVKEQPIETLKDSCEVGHLKKVTVTEDERGAVKQRKLEFETKSLETLNKEASNITQIEKGDVKLYQQLFETLPLDSISASDNECNAKREEVLVGNVKGNRHLFESTPLYAIRDNSGYYYKVTTVSREEVIKGDVQKCRWMFETKPLDQFDEEAGNVKIIKGITRQESCTGEVKTAKWLFETQPLDSIHKQINQTEESLGMKKEISERGDVSTCRWLFETQPMDVLYEKSDTIKEGESIPKADVKSYTWLFETQPLDAIKENTEKYLKVCDVYQDDVKNVDVKTVRHLFETESLDSSTSLQTGEQAFRCLSKVDIQSGDVSRVKEVFETKAIDSIGASSVKVSEVGDEGESIQAGSVHKFTWLFENGVIDTINSTESNKQHTCEVKPGEVGNKRFVFETFSLDQIHHLNKESECVTDSTEETLQKGDVKSSVLLFESQPLYAIQDKDGLFHEVTTVKKEEIMSGNVRGARWMFETKPLDSIKPEDEIYLIRAVTQEDIEKGDVKTARWRFETQPLDSFILGEKTVVKTVDDIQKGDVQSNKQIFECQRSNQKYVRMVSVSDVHRGDVRTSTWLFENQPIDSLKGGFQESTSVQKVHREDSHKGDVKRCTWLFETQPLDTLKDSEISSTVKTQEEMSQADVKRTTWLFETTPLDKFSSEHATNQSMQITESIKETLHRLSSFCAIRSHGIIIEANETTSVKMAKYQLTNSEGPMIQKDELVEGNIEAIMLQLLCTMNVEPHGILLKEDDQGNVNVTKLDLSVHHAKASSLTETEHTRADVAHALDNLLSQDKSVKKGILIQESNKGSVEMTVYSLFSQSETIKGDVKSTISNLLASTQEHKAAATIRLEESEKGNVNLYKTCIEKGELDYLKSCQDQTSEDTIDSRPKDQVDIIQGDVEGAKRHFGQIKESVERTVTDIVPGDVRSTKKVFLSENSMVSNVVNKEEILRGDVSSAKQSLNQAVKQPLVIQKEEIVSGDIKATLKSLEEAKNQSLKQERKTIVPGTIYDIQLPTEEITFTESGNEETLGHFSGCTAEEKHREEKISQARSASEESVTADHEASMQSLQQETAKQQMLHHHIQEKQDVFSQFAGQQQQMQQQIQVKQESKKVEKTVMQKKKMTCMTTVKESATLSTSQQKKLSSTTTVKESATSSTSQQKFLPTQPKVSKSVDLQGARQQTDACQGNEVSKSADINLKPVASATVNTTVNPFLSSDYDSQTVQEKSEKELVVKGDVKAAIKSLHNAAAEQRPLEKEEVVRGDLQAALQSLQKSSVNVSKGDFKAAMIYRNAGQSLSVSRKKGDNESVCNQSCAVSLSSSDTEFPTPVSVIDGGFQPSAVVTHPCETKTRSERSDCPTASKESVLANPPKSPEKVSPLKPALPPKPEHLTAGTSGRKGQKPSLPLKPDHLKERQQGPTVLLKDTPQKLPKSASFQQLPSKSLPCREVIQADATESLEKESHKEFSCHNEESHREGQIGSKQVCNKASRTSNPVAEKKNEVESKIQNKEQSAEVKLYTSGLSSESHNEKSNVKSLPQTIIATKDLQCSMQSDSKEGVTSMNTHQDFQASLHKFGGRRTGYVNVTSGSEMVKDDVAPIVVSPKKVRISQGDSTENTYKSVDEELRMQKEETIIDSTSSTSSEQLAKNVRPDGNAASEQKQLQCPPERPSKQQENKVILREKKRKNETEDERRQRLSVHKEEIMRGNVKAAMEIFENLRKKEELQIILSKVEELEGETLKVDVRSMRKFFENVPKWIVTPSSQVNQSKLKEAQKVKVTGSVKDDTESTSPVGVVFEDLERASAEIVRLKEQTLAKLMDIEEAIKKALFSVSSLKSEADIAGLSGLFRESLSTDEPIANTNSIRKISIVSSRSKSDDVKPVFESNSPLLPQADGEQKPSLEIPVTKPRASSPSSPSFISIQSAARKTSDPLTPKNSEKHIVNEVSSSDSTAFTPQESKPKNTAESSSLRGPNNESIRNVSSVSVDSVCSPLNPRRQKSVIAFQTIPEVPGIVGTKTVTEKYEEMDCFGNRIITSKTSTTVTKQSETKTSSTYEVVASPTRYEVMASPVLRRHAHSLAENNQCNGKVKEGGVVIVTFGSPKLGKK
ncbi:XIRP1 protein, partial [Polypterus senegalus]